jgi:hypothetical protein
VDGDPLASNALGESLYSAAPVYAYSTIDSAITAVANASGNQWQLAAVSTLPASGPVVGANLDIGTAEAKALGLIDAGDPAVDGYVGFASNATWSFAPDVTPAAGTYYFIGVVEHEITELLGRVSLLGQTNNYPNAYRLHSPAPSPSR